MKKSNHLIFLFICYHTFATSLFLTAFLVTEKKIMRTIIVY